MDSQEEWIDKPLDPYSATSTMFQSNPFSMWNKQGYVTFKMNVTKIIYMVYFPEKRKLDSRNTGIWVKLGETLKYFTTPNVTEQKKPSYKL